MLPNPELFGHTIYWYPFFHKTAVVTACVFFVWQFRRTKPVEMKLLPLCCLFGLLVGTGYLGARIFSGLEYLSEGASLQEALPLFWDFSMPGLRWFGVIFFFLVLFPLFARLFGEREVRRLFDVVALTLCLFTVVVKLACLFSGDSCYGVPTTLPWGMYFPYGIEPNLLPAHPTPLYDSLFHLGLFFFLLRFAGRMRFEGQLALLFYIATACFHLGLECLRRNEPLALNLTLAQWCYLAILLLAGWRWKRWSVKTDILSNKIILMKNIFALPILLLFLSAPLFAQLPYTEKAFDVYIEKDIPFGTATGFAGKETELTLDLYKPIGDGNCSRPLLVFTHGGGFVGGDKTDPEIVLICQEMAARGYVAASIEYRLGMHLSEYYEPYTFCSLFGFSNCIYMSDTMELSRALFRAVQDMKGAIRFLKGRHDLDSSDVHNVFVGGSSAGAFTSLHAALIDQPDERPPFCEAIADAPVADADLTGCLPSSIERSRPDLGSIEGEMNLNGHNAEVQGVGAFMGALQSLELLNGNSPPLYLYHRSDDLVVPWHNSQLFGMFPHCINPINLCMPLYNRPWAYGSQSILEATQGTGEPAVFDDILEGYGPADGDDCLDNPPGHSIDNIPLRCEYLSGFFAPVIAANGNSPTSNCLSAESERGRESSLRVFPNPMSGGALQLHCEHCPEGATELRLLHANGSLLATENMSGTYYKWELAGLAPGIYFVQALTAQGWTTKRVCIVHSH